jgi:BlaI family penicillinase repressor
MRIHRRKYVAMQNLPRISDTEWELMRVIWARQPVTAADIIGELQQEDPSWHPITAKTLLNRLVKKGAIDFTVKGRAYVYTARVKEVDCVRNAMDAFLNRVFEGSMSRMLDHYVSHRKVSPKQMRDLRKVVE